MSVGFAKKLGMTRIFIENKSIPVTVVKFEQTHILQKKSQQKEGYNSVQIGSIPKKRVSKALKSHIAKHSKVDTGLRLITEVKDLTVSEDKEFFDINDFEQNDIVNITGTTIGRGYTGAVKRWDFKGQPRSHGHDHVKAVGSMGSRWPQRVVKGKKMAGRFGGDKLTIVKVKILAIDKENSLIFLNGSLPGANSSFLKLIKVS
jgi:large subunit ribosomal protein L3